MRYNKIRKMDIADGPGVRVSIFMQGCAFNCKNCFNPETHDFNGGKEFTQETIDRVLELCGNENIEGLSILGGEPMNPKNIEGTTKLAKAKVAYDEVVTNIMDAQNDIFWSSDVASSKLYMDTLVAKINGTNPYLPTFDYYYDAATQTYVVIVTSFR